MNLQEKNECPCIWSMFSTISRYSTTKTENMLTLPVRRYLVPTPFTRGGGGGVEPNPYNFENGRLYNLQLWQAIRTIYER